MSNTYGIHGPDSVGDKCISDLTTGAKSGDTDEYNAIYYLSMRKPSIDLTNKNAADFPSK